MSEKEESNIFERKNAMTINFATLSQLILKDLKKQNQNKKVLPNYRRDQIINFLNTPSRYEKQLRDISNILYNKSSHYKRLIQHFSKMPTLDYIVEPIGIDYDKYNPKTIGNQYKKVLNFLENMNIKHEFSKILTTSFREDVFYGYEHYKNNSYFIQKLDPDYCEISSIEDGCYNFAFDFSYFDGNKDDLKMYPKEFNTKYNAYKKKPELKWQELDSSKTICIKINEDLSYVFPPFSGVFESLFEIQDYKDLRKDKAEISNYKVLVQKLPIREDSDHNNDFMIDYENMMMFHNKAAESLPDQVGLITSPMEIKDIDFDKDNVASDDVEKATREYWEASGVSQLLFNTNQSSSVGLENSIKTDEEIVFDVLRQIERWINRRLKFYINNVNFRIRMLDTTFFNRKEVFERAFKASQFGYPTKMIACAAMGLSPSSVNNMALLENEILGLAEKFIPLSSAHTGGDENNGAPRKESGELSEEGLRSRDK